MTTDAYQHWYSYLVPSKDGTNSRVSLFEYENITPESVIICQSLEYKKYTKFTDWYSLIKFIKKVKYSHRCFEEVIRKVQCQKFYIDCDIYVKNSTGSNECKFSIEEAEIIPLMLLIKDKLKILLPMISDSDIIITESNDSTKYSYHIIIDNWCVPSSECCKIIFNRLIESIPLTYRDALDSSMYSGIQNFRMYNSHKFNSDRVKLFSDKLSTWSPKCQVINEVHLEQLRFLYSCVTNTSYCTYLPFFDAKICTPVTYSNVSLDSEDIKEIMNLFKIFDKDGTFSYIETTGSFIKLKRNKPSLCYICDRFHQSENPYLFIIGNERKIYFDCRRSNGNSSKLYISELGSKSSDMITEKEETSEVELLPFSVSNVLNGLTTKTERIKLDIDDKTIEEESCVLLDTTCDDKKSENSKKGTESKRPNIFNTHYKKFSPPLVNKIRNLQNIVRCE